jgi:hypothetical protein
VADQGADGLGARGAGLSGWGAGLSMNLKVDWASIIAIAATATALLALAIAGAAHAQVVKYVDEYGVANYVSSESQVPPQYPSTRPSLAAPKAGPVDPTQYQPYVRRERKGFTDLSGVYHPGDKEIDQLAREQLEAEAYAKGWAESRRLSPTAAGPAAPAVDDFNERVRRMHQDFENKTDCVAARANLRLPFTGQCR